MENGPSRVNGSGKGLPSSGDPHVQEVVRAAHEELRQLMRQRAEVMKRIGTVKQTIVGLANLFGDGVLSDRNSGKSVGPVAVSAKTDSTFSIAKPAAASRDLPKPAAPC